MKRTRYAKRRKSVKEAMANQQPLVSNLVPYTTSDLEIPGVMLGAKVTPDDKAWLKQQKEGMSYHVRRAIMLYRLVLSDPQLSEQLFGKQENSHEKTR
ncbi:hypothetical protein [Aphanothece hegewaldii]|nr:hypothetical protein [Aphanothece hegewaldii]